MRKKFRIAAICLATVVFGSAVSYADLQERRGTAFINGEAYADVNVYYDNCLDVSFMDLNSGKLDWGEAHDFIETLSFVCEEGNVYDEWRLPAAIESEIGDYNMSEGELGHVFYVELANVSFLDMKECEEEGEEDDTCDYGLINTGPFLNLTDENPYWYGNDENATYVTYAPFFDFANGFQGEIQKSAPLYVLPVLDGDIAIQEEEQIQDGLCGKGEGIGGQKNQLKPHLSQKGEGGPFKRWVEK